MVSLTLMSIESPEPILISQPYHTADELRSMMAAEGVNTNLPIGTDENFFRGAGLCEGCHGFDPNGIASLDSEGNDVNPTDLWRATIMANSAKDPFWRAKVSHETTVNPNHTEDLEDKCTSCHAPMGHYGARFDEGATHYSMEELLTDSLGLDGVSCNACHAQSNEDIGTIFSGLMNFSADTIYGPHGDEGDAAIFSQPMSQFVGFEPVYGEHVENSELCAGCHSLITNTVDLDGNYTGNTFVEQSTYHEWLNSVYAEEGENNRECQSCHFPRLNEPVVISSNYAFLQPRPHFGKHYMVGGNTFMLELMKNRINELGITASEEDFDAVIERTMALLTQETLELEIEEISTDDDSLAYELKLINLSGHKFPSGYPARRAFIEFLVENEAGDTLFHSGAIENNYEVSGQDATYEPHYGVINSEDQVQIYEMVVADVNGDVTTVLERADSYLKDNRLTPIGFSTSHEVYDTTVVAGNALSDLDFNFEDGIEGSGSDRIIYKVPMNGYEGTTYVTARVHYQSVPPKWNEEMFSFNTPEIDAFREMYNQEGADPVLIAEVSSSSLVSSLNEVTPEEGSVIYPNPVPAHSDLHIEGTKKIKTVSLYTYSGTLIQNVDQINKEKIMVSAPGVSGNFLVHILYENGTEEVRSIIVM